MKKTNLFISAIGIALVTFTSCKKNDDFMASNHDQASASGTESSRGLSGAVYVIDNATAGNHVMLFSRTADGKLMSAGSYATGGMGTGSGLGSQGAVTNDDNFVYAVNAGSNEVSVLKKDGQSLTWVDQASSGGVTPISVTVHGSWLYVLNAGGTGNISGFSVSADGHLTHLAGSDQPLSSSSAGGAQVSFNDEGTILVVTQKAANMITVYPVDASGMAGAGTSYPSVGNTPFGFAFGNNNTLIVSDAFGGAALASALTSYTVSSATNLALATGPIATNQTAACWVATTNSGRFAYTTNAGSASISGYSVNSSGTLTLLGNTSTGTSPVDLGLSRNSQYLYNLNNGDHTINAFKVAADGSLTWTSTVTGIPAGSVGISAN